MFTGLMPRTADAASMAAGTAGLAVDRGDEVPSGEVDLAALSHGELVDEVVSLVEERARLEGRYLAVLGELVSRDGAQSAAWQLREHTRMNSAQARAESRLAEGLSEHDMAATVEALQAGEIQISHAKVIAREAPKQHRRSEAEFLELCRAHPSDVVARHTLAYRSQQVYADLAAEAAAEGRTLDPIDAEFAFQLAERSGSMRLSDDGMWHLRAKLDFIVGREVSQAIQAQVRSARHRDGAEESTRTQLTADAISDLIAGTSKTRRANTSLLIIADYDMVNDRIANPRLDDGTPLSAQQLVELAADARVLPAMFNSDWSELALGRTRNASDAQRLVLAARDGGCIGCDLTSEHTQAHHIQFFENDGLTDIPNTPGIAVRALPQRPPPTQLGHPNPAGRPPSNAATRKTPNLYTPIAPANLSQSPQPLATPSQSQPPQVRL